MMNEGKKMNEAKHTPGPWNVRIDLPDMDGDEISQIVKIDPKVGGMDYGIAQVHFHGGEFGPQERADAALIAAAPDLLAALEMLILHADAKAHLPSTLNFSAPIQAARVAVAKAKGLEC